jgi:phage/plasmid-associated DNA primase
VNGAHQYCTTKVLPLTDLSRQILTESKGENDTLQQFIDEHFVKNPMCEIRTSEFKELYDKYSGKKETAAWIKDRVTKKGFDYKKKKDANYFTGLKYTGSG